MAALEDGFNRARRTLTASSGALKAEKCDEAEPLTPGLIAEPIDLGGHDEVVLVQTFDLLGL